MGENNSLKKFQKELKILFRSEDKDFNWGIYRIMNQKNEEITQFIEKELPKIVEDENLAIKESQIKKIDEKIKEIVDACKTIHQDPKENEEYNVWIKKRKETMSVESIEDSIYNHLIEFFNRYYQDGDFINEFYFKDDQYLIPYDGSETMLHWATKDMYYVKSSEQYKRFSFLTKDNKVSVALNLSNKEEEKGNKKESRDKYFVFDNIKWENDELICNIKYIGLNDEIKSLAINEDKRKEILDEEIISQIKKELGKQAENLDISKNLEKFKKRYIEDFFIHKDLKKFLEGQMNFYINQEILHIDSFINDDGSINDDLKLIAKVFKSIGKNIIEKLDLLEKMKRKIWEKKKFVLNTDYCITLDYIDEKYYPEILANNKQLDEWKNLFSFDMNSEIAKLNETLKGHGKNDEEKKIEVLKQNPTLTIDTKLFSTDFKYTIISDFNELDNKITGILINSENYQALKLIRNKYKNKIKCSYIDPPYNAKSSEILYKNNYKNSSWLTLIDNRISLSKDLLKDDFVKIIAIDEIEQEVLGQLLTNNFPNNKKVCLSIVHNPRGQQGKNVSYNHEFAYIIYPNDAKKYLADIKREEIDSRNLRDSGTESNRENAASCFYPFIIKDNEIVDIGKIPNDDFHPPKPNVRKEDNKIEIWPIDESGVEKKWRYSNTSVSRILDKLEVKRGRNFLNIIFNKDTGTLKSLWSNARYDASEYGTKLIQNILGTEAAKKFSYPKSIYNVKDLLTASISDDNQSIIIDYFAGSGTTGHALLEINNEDNGFRKFILIEMGEYFDTVLKPRILKVIYSNNWKDGIPSDNNGFSKQIIKYHTLEQYEDSLENIVFKQTMLDDYVDNSDLLIKYFLEEGIDKNKSKNFLGIETEQDFLDLKIYVLNEDGSKTPHNVDLIESFNYLIGLEVDKIRKINRNKRDYYIITGKTDNGKTIVIWRKPNNLDREEDKKVINKFLIEDKYQNIYINSDANITESFKNIYDEMREQLCPEPM
jgi:adenine-specific DNA-methyltransferase